MKRNTADNSQYTATPAGKIAIYTANGIIFKNAPTPRRLSVWELIIKALFG